MTKSQISYTLPSYEFSELFNPNKTVAQKSADVIMKVNLTSNKIFDAHLLKNMMIKHWLITQKLFLGSGTEKILYISSERALKMLSFDSYIRCIGACGGVGEHI